MKDDSTPLFSQHYGEVVFRFPLLPDSLEVRRQVFQTITNSGGSFTHSPYLQQAAGAFKRACSLSVRSNRLRNEILGMHPGFAPTAKFEKTLKRLLLRATTRSTPNRLYTTLSTAAVGQTSSLKISQPLEARCKAHRSARFLSEALNYTPAPNLTTSYTMGQERKKIVFGDGEHFLSTKHEYVQYPTLFLDEHYGFASLEDNATTIADHRSDIEVFGTREGSELVVDEKVVAAALSLNDELIRRTARPDPLYQTFSSCYRDRYGQESQPLAEVFDLEVGICSHLTEALNEHLEQDSIYERALAAYLTQEISENAQGVIELDNFINPYKQAHTNVDAGALLIAFTKTGANDVDFEFIDSGAGIGSEMFARFAVDDERLSRLNSKVWEKLVEGTDKPFAELVYCPHPYYARELCLRPSLSEQFIPLSTSVGMAQGSPVTISNLMIGVEREDVYLFNRETGLPVTPTLNSSHNFRAAQNHPLYRWLPVLNKQHVYGFQWPRTFQRVASLPAVKLRGKTIKRRQLSATWLRRSAGDRKQVLRALRNWSSGKSIKIGRGDQFLPINLDEEQSVDVLFDLLEDLQNVIVEDNEPSEIQVVHDGFNTYRHEVIIPFFRSTESAPSKKIVPKRHQKNKITATERLVEPDWLYIQWTCNRSAHNRLLRDIIGPVAQNIVAQGLAEKWFFVRYRDPDDHLRIRFQCKGDTKAALSNILLQLSEDALRERRIADWRLLPYVPELTRYGGRHSLSECHEEFWRSSTETIRFIERHFSLPEDEISAEEEIACAIYLSRLCYSSVGDLNSTLRLLGALRTSAEASEELKPDFAFARQRYHQLKLLLDRRAKRIREEMFSASDNSLKQCVNDLQIVSSVFHMHCNRLMGEWSRPREVTAVLTASRLVRAFTGCSEGK